MKKLISIVLALTLCLSLTSGAFALFADTQDETPEVSSIVTSEGSTRAEETEWVTRITDEGWIQVRLWSITYGYWKTDWITIGHT